MTDETNTAKRGVFHRRLALGCAGMALLLLGVPLAYLAVWWWFPSVPAVHPPRVRKVVIEMYSQSQAPRRVESTDAVAISELIGVLEKAERTGEHKCASIAKLTIVAVDGKTWELSLLPGHDDSFYEFRYARRINRVPRAELLAVLRRLGAGDFFETTRSN